MFVLDTSDNNENKLKQLTFEGHCSFFLATTLFFLSFPFRQMTIFKLEDCIQFLDLAYFIRYGFFSQAFCESVPIACIKPLCILNLQWNLTALKCGALSLLAACPHDTRNYAQLIC